MGRLNLIYKRQHLRNLSFEHRQASLIHFIAQLLVSTLIPRGVNRPRASRNFVPSSPPTLSARATRRSRWLLAITPTGVHGSNDARFRLGQRPLIAAKIKPTPKLRHTITRTMLFAVLRPPVIIATTEIRESITPPAAI